MILRFMISIMFYGDFMLMIEGGRGIEDVRKGY